MLVNKLKKYFFSRKVLKPFYPDVNFNNDAVN